MRWAVSWEHTRVLPRKYSETVVVETPAIDATCPIVAFLDP
jgi:hypothetical protein